MPSYIGYQNWFDTGTASASTGTAADGIDYITEDYWEPTASSAWIKVDAGSAVDADYVGIAGHTLNSTSSSIKVQYSTDDAAWSDAYTAAVPGTDRAYFKAFTTHNARYWRLLVTYSGTAPKIGHISIGKRWEIGIPPDGFVRTVHTRANTYINSINQNGVFMGRSVQRRGYSRSIQVNPISIASMAANFDPFMTHAETKPFFFQFDATNYPNDNLFCWLSGADPQPSRTGHYYESVEIQVNGI